MLVLHDDPPATVTATHILTPAEQQAIRNALNKATFFTGVKPKGGVKGGEYQGGDEAWSGMDNGDGRNAYEHDLASGPGNTPSNVPEDTQGVQTSSPTGRISISVSSNILTAEPVTSAPSSPPPAFNSANPNPSSPDPPSCNCEDISNAKIDFYNELVKERMQSKMEKIYAGLKPDNLNHTSVSDSAAPVPFALPGSFILSFFGIMLTWTLLWLFSLWRGSSAFKAFFGVLPAVLSSLFVFAYSPSIATLDLGLPSFISSEYTLMALRYPCLAAACLLVLDVVGLLALASECGRSILRWCKGEGWRFGWGWTTVGHENGGRNVHRAHHVHQVNVAVPAPWDLPAGQFI